MGYGLRDDSSVTPKLLTRITESMELPLAELEETFGGAGFVEVDGILTCEV